MNLYLKINKIMEEVRSLKKDGQVAFGTTRYSFLSEAKTTETFREKLIEYKLVLFPIKVSDHKEGNVTQGHYVYRLLNAEEPSEFIDIESTGQGQDSSDKGSGKASSYAYKYLLWRTFAVPSNDDPDNISSAETNDKEKKAEAAAQKKQEEEMAKIEKEKNEFINKIQIKAVDSAIKELNVNWEKFSEYFNVSTVGEITKGQLNEVNEKLEEQRKKMKK